MKPLACDLVPSRCRACRKGDAISNAQRRLRDPRLRFLFRAPALQVRTSRLRRLMGGASCAELTPLSSDRGTAARCAPRPSNGCDASSVPARGSEGEATPEGAIGGGAEGAAVPGTNPTAMVRTAQLAHLSSAHSCSQRLQRAGLGSERYITRSSRGFLPNFFQLTLHSSLPRLSPPNPHTRNT